MQSVSALDSKMFPDHALTGGACCQYIDVNGATLGWAAPKAFYSQSSIVLPGTTMFENHIEELEKIIGHRFQRENLHLLEEARTTRAYHNEHKHVKDQEVLAKLGDAVLKPIIVANLIAAGANTAKEINDSQQILECRKNLAGVASKMGIAEHLNLGAGEGNPKQTDHKNALGESLEAIIGAIYLDAGFEKARALAEKYLL